MDLPCCPRQPHWPNWASVKNFSTLFWSFGLRAWTKGKVEELILSWSSGGAGAQPGLVLRAQLGRPAGVLSLVQAKGKPPHLASGKLSVKQLSDFAKIADRFVYFLQKQNTVLSVRKHQEPSFSFPTDDPDSRWLRLASPLPLLSNCHSSFPR